MNPERFVLLGHPLGHSLSPFLHTRLFALNGREAVYTLEDVPPGQLPESFPALLGRIRGCNVTIPYKQAVIPFLTALQGRAELYRSVNTVAVTETGAVGYNTDAEGFLASLRDADVPLSGQVVLLGAGGVGRTFACEAALAGARIVNAVRESSLAAAESLKAYVRGLVPGVSYDVVPLSRLADWEEDIDLLINATPVGMHPHPDASPVEEAVLRRTAAVFDAVYNPGETRLLRMAKAGGAKTVGGMPMLVWQAAAAHACWYGGTFDPADVRQLIADAYAELARSFG